MTEALVTARMGKMQLFGMMLVWFICGFFGGPIVFGVVPISVLYLGQKRMHLALIVGFIFVLILADSRLQSLVPFKNLRSIYLICLAIFMGIDITLRPVETKFYKVFVPFFLIALLWLFNSNMVLTSFAKVISYLLILLVVPTYLNRVYDDYEDIALKYIVYFGLFILSIGLILWGLRMDVVFMSGRYRGIFGNPNGIGIFTMLFLFFVVIINTHKPFLFSNKERILFYGIIILSLLLCRSRSALGGIILFLFFRQFYKISRVIGVFILIAIVIFYQLILAYLPEIIAVLNLETYIRADSLQNASGRLIAIQFAWEHISQNIWIGRGMGFSEAWFHRNAYILNPLGHQGGTHNAYLTMWLDTGIVGLLLFAGAWLINFWKASKNSYLAYPLMIAVAFSSFFESWIVSSINAFTIVLILILTLLMNTNFTNDSDERTTDHFIPLQ